MLESSNILNTINTLLYSHNVKTVTMNNQQVVLSKIININVLIVIQIFKDVVWYLRDFMRRGILLLGCLRYSPLFCVSIKLGHKLPTLIYVSKVLKREFSTSRCLASVANNKVASGASSCKAAKDKLDPSWITGFVDAEGCFSVIIEVYEDLNWKVRVSFEINLHEKDKDILYKIQSFFGVGAIYHRPDRKKSVYRVTNITYINNVIIPHFTKYPLISKKSSDFLLWSKVVDIISKKDHLTKEGFLNVLSYYASINKGVSSKVLKYYPDISPANKPIVYLPDNLNPQWVSGFTAGDGGFSIYVRPAKDYTLGEKVYCRFHIAQHSKDIELMHLFIRFFNCGQVVFRSSTSTPRCDFIVQDTSFLLENIISHFDIYPLLNLKQEDFLCFKEALLLIKEKKHLTKEGLDKIKSLNLEMNSNRLR